jgi:hypothetical protein
MQRLARHDREQAKDSPGDREPTKELGALSLLWGRLTNRTRPNSQRATEPQLPTVSSCDDTKPPSFVEKRRKLEALAKEFGHDPSKVCLNPRKRIFEYLGQSFTAEGEAWPDGRIDIYFDPDMSDARMGCCLAHELQHLKYFAVRDAYRAESAGGPLHRRFARFTPELLAAQRGVSDYSNEHWDAWKGSSAPSLFSLELEEGGCEPINETIADVAKAQYNWGPDVWINPVWKELEQAINEAYEELRTPSNGSR